MLGVLKAVCGSFTPYRNLKSCSQLSRGCNRSEPRGCHYRPTGEFVRGREVHRSSVDILQSLHHAIALMEPLARGKGVVLTTAKSEGIPIVLADPIQIEQVIVNLLANAIDAVAVLPERKRRVTVNVQVSDAGAVEVVVNDGGYGVPPELRDKLFEAFVSTKKDGLGVGLTISRTIIRATWRQDLDGASRAVRNVLPFYGAVGQYEKRVSSCRLIQRSS